MDTILQYPLAALNSLQELVVSIGAVVPAIVAALVLLLLGALIGRYVRTLCEYLMRTVRVDDYSRQFGLSAILTRLGFGPSLMHLVGVVVHATVILAFVLVAADAVGFRALSEYLHRVIDFLPRCIAAVFVLGAGLFFGDIFGGIIHRAAEANRVRGSEPLMRVTHGIIVIFSAFISLEYLGIDIRILNDHMPIVIGSLGLGLAIALGVAFGMAGRDMAERWIRDLQPRASKALGNGHEPKMRVVK